MRKLKSIFLRKNFGMTYVELIVVLSIMSIMSAVVLFNYQDFQEKVDIKNLSTEIAQKLVQAQKFSMSGEFNIEAGPNWVPSYGLFFSKSNSKKFTYFADLDNTLTSSLSITSYNAFTSGNPFVCSLDNPECIDVVNINKDYYISDLKIVFPPSGLCKIDGGGGGGGSTGDCVSRKQEIAKTYELKYSPPTGYFEDKNISINPNQGLYPFKDVFVDLNIGKEFPKDDFESKFIEIGGEKVKVYILDGSTGIDSVSGYFIDLKTAEYVYIPTKEPSICNDNKNNEGDFSIGTEPGYASSVSVNNLAITFKRPDSKAFIQTDSGLNCVPSYAEIYFNNIGSKVLIYPSGRVQIK